MIKIELDELEKNIINYDKKKKINYTSKKQIDSSISISARKQTIRKNKRLFFLLNVMDQVNSDEEKVIFFIREYSKINTYVFSKMISGRFMWSDTRTKRALDKLLKNELIEIMKYCPYCGKNYNRIPKVCRNKDCSKILIRQKGIDDNKLKRPRFLIKILQKGKDFIDIRLTDYRSALRLYKQKLNNI